MPGLAYRPLGAFRLLLAMLVVQHHYLANLAPADLSLLAQPYEPGSIAVLAFFALSGFVICEAADGVYAERPLAYFVNRLLRVAPLFIVVTAAPILVFWIFDAVGTLRVERHGVTLPSGAFGGPNVLANLLGFVPFSHLFMRFGFLDVAWTLRIEMLFYLALGAALCLAGAGRSFGRSSWSLGRTSAFVAAATTPLFVLAVARRAPETFALAPYFWFGGGLYFALAHRSRAARWVVAVAAGAIAWEFLSRPPLHPALGFERAVGAQLVLLVALLGAIPVLAAWRLTRPQALDRALGDLTYALYLSHLLVMVAILSLTTGYSLAGYLAALALSVPVAVGFHTLVEPGVNRLREQVRRGRLKLAREEPGARLSLPR